MHFKEA
ncbi:uncharacterized protein FFMR_04822 [Fusarium fujikuroi]|nr:uncharacterized protein FFMR_04822 [Fusarium fujikuroi]